MRQIIMCKNPKLMERISGAYFAAAATEYPHEYVNEQYREFKAKQIKSPAAKSADRANKKY